MNLPNDIELDKLSAQEEPDSRRWRYTCTLCGQRQRFTTKEAARDAAWGHAEDWPCEARCREVRSSIAKPPGIPTITVPPRLF